MEPFFCRNDLNSSATNQTLNAELVLRYALSTSMLQLLISQWSDAASAFAWSAAVHKMFAVFCKLSFSSFDAISKGVSCNMCSLCRSVR